mgnify:CR=1 FL=1
MFEAYKLAIQGLGHEKFIACMIKRTDDGSNLHKKLDIRFKFGITNVGFIQFSLLELQRFKTLHRYSDDILESEYNVKFCNVHVRNKSNISFKGKPTWSSNMIYIST